MSLGECMASTTSSEFSDWMEYIHEEEWGQHSKLDHYLAQIACEVHNIAEYLFAKKPKARNTEDFLLKFRLKEDAKPEPTAPPAGSMTPEEEWKLRREIANRHKMQFLPFLTPEMLQDMQANGATPTGPPAS